MRGRIKATLTLQRSKLCACVCVCLSALSITGVRSKETLLSLEASAFFILHSFNYSKWKYMKIPPLLLPFLSLTFPIFLLPYLFFCVADLVLYRHLSLYLYLSRPLVSFTLPLLLSCSLLSPSGPFPELPRLKASQRATYLLTQVRGHM